MVSPDHEEQRGCGEAGWETAVSEGKEHGQRHWRRELLVAPGARPRRARVGEEWVGAVGSEPRRSSSSRHSRVEMEIRARKKLSTLVHRRQTMSEKSRALTATMYSSLPLSAVLLHMV